MSAHGETPCYAQLDWATRRNEVLEEQVDKLRAELAEARAALSDMNVWLPWASELFPGDEIEAWKVKHATALQAAKEAQ